jgi:hypothetical protein
MDLLDRENLVVELSRPLDVGHSERNVMNGSDFHTGAQQANSIPAA